MKHCLLIFSLIAFVTLQVAYNQHKVKTYKAEYMYPFQGYYINLENLQRIEADGILATTFKTASKYATRFDLPRWFKSMPQTTVFKNHRFDITHQQLRVTHLANQQVKIIERQLTGRSFLVSVADGVVQVQKSDKTKQYLITKYDEKGASLFTTALTHTQISTQGNVQHNTPYLNYLAHTPTHMLFSSYHKKYPITHVVHLEDGRLSTLGFQTNGIIRGAQEKLIKGFVQINADKKTLKTNFLNFDWTVTLAHSHNFAETLLIDNVLIIATYHRLSTGAALYAYDAESGKLLWKAKVSQLATNHSQYYNMLLLSAFRKKIILEGVEAHGNYLQIFDIKTGKKLFDSLTKK